MVAMSEEQIKGREPVLYQGYRALCLAIFDRACMDVESGYHDLRRDALDWLRGEGAELLDLAGYGVQPSAYRQLLAGLEAKHAQKTAEEERERELAAFWKVIPGALELYGQQATACLLS